MSTATPRTLSADDSRHALTVETPAGRWRVPTVEVGRADTASETVVVPELLRGVPFS